MGRRHRRAEANEPEGRRVSQGKSKTMAKHMDKAAQGPRGRKENGSDPFFKSASPFRVSPPERVGAKGVLKITGQRSQGTHKQIRWSLKAGASMFLCYRYTPAAPGRERPPENVDAPGRVSLYVTTCNNM